MEYEPKYVVSVRGKEFTLSKSQIEFDPPNYFTACFLGDYHEAKTRRLEIFRNPELFSVVVDYLCGYNVLPLAEGSIPATMSPQNALLNLRADAAFYQLEGLIQECDKLIAAGDSKPPPKPQYLILTGKTVCPELMFLSLDSEDTKHPAFMIPHKASSQSSADEEKLREAPLDKMKTPESLNETDRPTVIAAIEGFISRSMDNYDRNRWKLIGWHAKGKWFDDPSRFEREYLVVLKDLEFDNRSR